MCNTLTTVSDHSLLIFNILQQNRLRVFYTVCLSRLQLLLNTMYSYIFASFYTKNVYLPLTGNVPGSAASKADTWLLIGAANCAAEPENNFEFAEIWAWISKPTTGSHLLQKNHKAIYILQNMNCWGLNLYMLHYTVLVNRDVRKTEIRFGFGC